jgi:hypothetical protein
MVAPLPPLGVGLLPYAMVASFMVLGSVYVLSRLFPRSGESPDIATVILMLGILLMTTGLWFAEIYAVLDPGDASTVSVFIALNSMMGVVGFWAVGLFLRAEEKHLPTRGWFWPLCLAALVVGNELLMGVAFVLAQVGPSVYSAEGWAGLAAVVADGIDSVWFFGVMFLTMEFLVFWLPMPSQQRRALAGFSTTALVGPFVLTAPLEGAIAMAAVMAAVLALVVREAVREPSVSVSYVRLVVAIAVAFGATGVAALAFLTAPLDLWSPVPFALVSFFVMLLEVLLLAHWVLGRAALRIPTVPTPVPAPGRAEEKPSPSVPG